jgi:serine/threonine protein kinase
MGAILAELYTLRPLFPGSSEADEIYKICSIMGSPTMRTWPEGIKLAAQMQFRFPQFVPTSLAQLIPHASQEAITLMQDLMLFDPQQRPTSSQVLQYPYFHVNNSLPQPSSSTEPIPSTFTRRPVMKSENEIKIEEKLQAKKVIFYFFTLFPFKFIILCTLCQAQELLEKGQTFYVPEVNILHETEETARVSSFKMPALPNVYNNDPAPSSFHNHTRINDTAATVLESDTEMDDIDKLLYGSSAAPKKAPVAAIGGFGSNNYSSNNQYSDPDPSYENLSDRFVKSSFYFVF